MLIRRLGVADYEEFKAIRGASLEAHPESYATNGEDWRNAPREKIEALLVADDAPIIGAFRPRLIGIVGLRREGRPSVRHKASLWGLYVDPGHRREGVATALVSSVLTLASSLPGLELVRLVVDADNAAAISVFARSGFEQYGLEPRARLAVGRYHDQLYMYRPVARTAD